MVGQKYGMLTVLSVDQPQRSPNGTLKQMLRCKCDCGQELVVSYSHLKAGQKSCGCIKHVAKYEDLTGCKFGKLLVEKHLGRVLIGSNAQYSQLWKCACDCGNRCLVNSRDLKSGNTKSCGCIQGETLRSKHLNQYDLSGRYGIGYCSNGQSFMFDLCDYDLIKDYTWYLNSGGYLITTFKGSHYRMHRLICGISEDDDREVDHINHVTTDNRRSNLRVCTHQQNSFNKITPSNNSTGHIGVSIDSNGDYRASIMIDGKSIELGSYSEYDDAVSVREIAEKRYFNEFAIERG